jgi:hypothetical protein
MMTVSINLGPFYSINHEQFIEQLAHGKDVVQMTKPARCLTSQICPECCLLQAVCLMWTMTDPRQRRCTGIRMHIYYAYVNIKAHISCAVAARLQQEGATSTVNDDRAKESDGLIVADISAANVAPFFGDILSKAPSPGDLSCVLGVCELHITKVMPRLCAFLQCSSDSLQLHHFICRSLDYMIE